MSVAIATQPAPSANVASFLRRPGRLLIGGEWLQSTSQVRIPVVDPATGAEIATVPDASAADVDKAVERARTAQHDWRRVPGLDRAKLLHEVAARMRAMHRELAETMTLEGGKPMNGDQASALLRSRANHQPQTPAARARA